MDRDSFVVTLRNMDLKIFAVGIAWFNVVEPCLYSIRIIAYNWIHLSLIQNENSNPIC
jgi:hypothetical protein